MSDLFAAFGAGALTSAGPCVAPRYLTLAAIVHGAARPWSVIVTYVGGLVAAMIALGLTLDVLTRLRDLAGVIDAGLALALATAGLATLARGATCAPHHAHRPQALVQRIQSARHFLISRATVIRHAAALHIVAPAKFLKFRNQRDNRVKLVRFAEPEPARTIGLAWRHTSPRKRDFAALGEVVTEALGVAARRPASRETSRPRARA